MQFYLRLILCGAISVTPVAVHGQGSVSTSADHVASLEQLPTVSDPLPDAPGFPDPALTTISEQQTPNNASGQSSSTQSGGQDSSSTQEAPAQSDEKKAQEEKAEEQIKEQEKQRLLGVVPMFNITYRNDAVSLTAKQKMSLAFRSAIDPVTFAAAIGVAGWGEIINSDTDNGFGWGADGFAKRAGAKYLDAFDGTMIGNGILPSLLHQDPRYFRLGHGSTTHRALYAVAAAFICKHDNTGKWEPNYSNVGGNLAAGAISNLYYPTETGWSTTIINGMVVTAEGAVGAVFQEFWPDISRKVLHKDPTHGLDAQAATAGAATKQEGQPQGR
jgi:hypothetical protein